jgi:hypothetical protein
MLSLTTLSFSVATTGLAACGDINDGDAASPAAEAVTDSVRERECAAIIHALVHAFGTREGVVSAIKLTATFLDVLVIPPLT